MFDYSLFDVVLVELSIFLRRYLHYFTIILILYAVKQDKKGMVCWGGGIIFIDYLKKVAISFLYR